MTDLLVVPVGDVKVGDRARKELRHVEMLAESIRDVGLLHPLVVNSRMELVAGARRLEAVKRCGWATVPVRVVASLDDAVKALVAERDENTCREHLTPTELVELGRAIEAIEKPAAKQRQKEHGGTAPGKTKNTSGKLPGVFTGDTRDKVASVLGVSGKTYEKAKKVVAAAEADPEKFGDLPAAMDETSVHAAHEELKARQNPDPEFGAVEEPEGADEAPEGGDDHPADEPAEGSGEETAGPAAEAPVVVGAETDEEPAGDASPPPSPPGSNPYAATQPPKADPDHPHADFLAAISAFAGKVSKFVNDADPDSKLRTYLLNVGFVFPRDKGVNGRHYGWQCVGLRGLYRVVKLAGLPGKAKSKDKVVGAYQAAMHPEVKE